MGLHDDFLVLNRANLDGLNLTWAEVMDVIDDAFVQKARGEVQNPPKPKVAPRSDAFVNAMPAFLAGSDSLGIKWVSGFEQNRTKDLPYIYGALLMNDADTGRPLALIDGGWVTEKRTAAVSGVTLRHVPGSVGTLGIIGAGLQGNRHLEVALEVHPEIEHVRVFDHREAHGHALLAQAGERVGTVVHSALEATRDADLVISSISRRMDPRLDGSNTAPDALILPVDYDDTFGPDVVREAAFFAVDDRGQYDSVLHRAFQGYRDPDGELAQLVSGEMTVPDHGRRVFTNMGLAMEDVALGTLILERATATGAGTTITFP